MIKSIKIYETKRIEKTIEIEYPYYFCFDNDCDSIDSKRYGKILEGGTVTEISVTHYYNSGNTTYKIEVSNFNYCESYFKLCHKSNEKAFNGIKKEFIDFLATEEY